MKIKTGIQKLGFGHCKLATSKRGFTIAEMLLVLIIIGLLMSIGARTYYKERDRFVYNDSLTKVLLLIRSARDSATSSRGVPIGGKNVVPPSGYGVYINLEPLTGEPNFTLFASTTALDPANPVLNTKFNKSTDTILDTLRLPGQIHFQFFKFNQGSAWEEKWTKVGADYQHTATEAVILFRPPLAESYIAGGVSGTYSDLQDIGMRFFNPDSPVESPKRCQYITFNKIRTFAEISYSDCTESTYPAL